MSQKLSNLVFRGTISNIAASGEDFVVGDVEVEEVIDELLSILCHKTNLLNFKDLWKVNESSINIRSIGFYVLEHAKCLPLKMKHDK